jgi:hypothetical protein
MKLYNDILMNLKLKYIMNIYLWYVHASVLQVSIIVWKMLTTIIKKFVRSVNVGCNNLLTFQLSNNVTICSW